MASKEEIGSRYLDQARLLEGKFFDIVDEGLPSQHRQLKAGKSIDDFNIRHAQIWQSHEAELIAEGFLQLPEAQPPARDLAAEIDEIKAKLRQAGIV